MKKYLYLVRHGETLFNQQKKIQGWCDSPLTPRGQKQALKVKEYLNKQGIQFDGYYSSTSERCCDTLELITDQPYQRLKGLKEMNYGQLEGEGEYLGSKDPKECETYYLPFGGESSNTVRDRMVDTLSHVMQNHQSILVVSHGGACFNFLRAFQDPTPVLEKGITNGCLFIYEYSDTFQLIDVIR